jgi:cell division initiation protein
MDMITAQDIRERTFERARINGYEPASVDDFLDQLAEEVAASQKENAVLKAKMKVLVDKIEEYRGNEEALNLALLSAQKLAVQIEKEAKDRAAAMIADAERQVKARIGSIEEETEIQKRRLADAQAATAKYFDSVRSLCGDQLRKLDTIAADYVPAQEEAPAEEAPVVVEEQPQAEPAFDFDLNAVENVAAHLGLDSTQTFNM